jgi:hypothetical protein
MQRPSQRFPLLVYQRIVRRFRLSATLLAFLLLAFWYPVHAQWLAWPRPPADNWLLAGGATALAFGAMAWLGGRLAYAQAQRDHLRVQTPVFRMQVSYRRIVAIGPADIESLFPAESTPRGLRRMARAFYGQTALRVDLSAFPLPRWFLHLFLHRLFFAPDGSGLILMVAAWEGLSLQLSARIDSWRSAQAARGNARRGPASAEKAAAASLSGDARLAALAAKFGELEELLVLHSSAPPSAQRAMAQRVQWVRKAKADVEALPSGIKLQLTLSGIRRTLRQRRGSFSNYHLSPARHGILTESQINSRFRWLISEIMTLCNGGSNP